MPVRGYQAVAERPDGIRVPFVPYPTPLFDHAGEFVGAVNVLVDISELKTSEQRITESDTRFREIFKNAGVAVWEQLRLHRR